MLRVEVHPGQEFKEILTAIRVVDKKLPGDFKRKLRDVSKDAMRSVQAAVLALPANSGESSGLRRRVARGVRMKISPGGSQVRIITTMRDPEEAIIPRGLDTPTGWRHPVFGTDEWVQQPGGSWFREDIADYRNQFVEAFETVLEDARDTLARIRASR